MAQGDTFFFDKFFENVLDSGIHNFGGTPNEIRAAIVSNATVPTQATPNPCWGAGGTTNFQTNELTGTNFPAGGKVCAVASATINGSAIEIDFGDPTTWAQDPGNPSGCAFCIVYDNTTANKNCIGFVDLGTPYDATTGDLVVTFGTPFGQISTV